MGVWGLTSLVEDNPCIFRDCSFRGGRLVIDGSNLLGLLYFQSGLDQNHGGEYAAFEELVENFITALRTCSVSPFMVLDGGLDVSGKKFQMLAERGEELTHRAHRAAVEGSQENIRPLLANLVFIQTLVRLKVPMVVYDETDQEIAALAKEWDCPVLSSNSDFYIFDIPAGMLPLSHFRWRALKQRDSQSFIPCKNYRTSNFCTFFGIQKQLLPTFAALAGNYFVKLKIPDRRQFSPAHVKKRHYLWGLLSWLKRFHVPEKAVEAILEQVNAEQQQETQDRLYRGIREYQLPSSCLKMFFIHGIPPPVPEAAGVVPDWIQSCLVRGEMNPDVLDVLRLQRRRLQVCVGSSELPSAHQTSEPLRQVMYGLLVPRHQVVEMDRVGLNLEEISVQPVVTATIKKLALNSLPKAEHSQRLQVLLEALNVNEASLSRLPSELQLPVAVTCYWWQNARPTPDVQLLKALLLGLSVGASQSPEAALLFERTDFDLSHSMAHNVIQWQSCLKECISLNQLLCHPIPPPHISRLYKGALVHHLIQQMMSRKLKNFLKKDLSRVLEYKNMLAIVRRFDSWQQPCRRRVFHQGHQPPVKETVSDMWRLYDEEEEAAAVRALKDVDLGPMVSLKARHTAKDKRKWNRNPVMVCKGERRGKDLI